jgi:predicted  nucleic acid-binding Zn-ribbon protein
MFKCERCGAGYSPIRAAILEFCPRCWARHRVRVPLLARVVKDSPPGRLNG